MVKHIKINRRYDVAKAAGVSVVTVTYALGESNRVRMSEETQQRIRRIASELGYRPDYLQKSRIAGKTFSIGLLQPDPDTLFNLFYQHIVHGLVSAMNQDGYDLLTLFRSCGNRCVNIVQQGRLDGLVILQSDLADDHIRSLAATGIPLVLINRALPDDCQGRVACIHHDNRAMMRAAVDYAVQAGCVRLFYVNTADGFTNKEVLATFTEATGNLVPRGVIGSYISPVHADFLKLARTLLSGISQRDAVITDGRYFTETILQAGRELGKEPGHGYHLITAATSDEDRSATRAENLCFCQEPELLGGRAWALLKRVMDEKDVPRVELLPYRRDPD